MRTHNIHDPLIASIESVAIAMRDCYESMSPPAKAAALELSHAMADLRLRLLDREAENVIELANELRQGQGMLPGIRL